MLLRLFAVRGLREVRELVRTQQELATLSSEGMTLLVGSVDVILHGASLDSSKESTFVLNAQEYLPCLLSNRGGELLDVI